METNKINSANILNAFNNYNKSFNAAIRFIFDLSKEASGKVPAAPAKDDNSKEAKQIRKDIKAVERRNAIIADAKEIVETFNVTANDIKGKAISALREKIVARIPNVNEEGNAVKFAKLPAYLKSEVKDYKDVFQVVPASWIEAICAAADNEKCIKKEYECTIAPVIEEGAIVEGANGNIVDANGNIVNSDKIFEVWNREAVINNIANAAGSEARTNKRTELKAK